MDYLQYIKVNLFHFNPNDGVLNLIINGLPSIPRKVEFGLNLVQAVLNLIINGLPSIRNQMYS